MAKSPRIYQQLADWAGDQGYPKVTSAAVQEWVKAGLLPHAGRDYRGFGNYRTTLAPDIHDRLLTLCRYRYGWQVGRHSMLQALLWLDGYSVPSDGIRASQPGLLGRGIRREIARQRAEAALQPRGWRLSEGEIVTSALAKWAPLADLLGGLSETDRSRSSMSCASWAERASR